MFPTEDDFANVFESYVHKDDTIDPDKVKVDDKTISEILDGKSDDGHKHEIADVNGLESALNAISQILGKQESETIVQLAQRFASLTGKYTNVYTFVTKVKEFLEDADAADETINRWREIESFLQGITDTETLLGLLQEMKQEILQSIPQPQQGNYLELVDDLDAYTDAPDGKVVKYIGPTTDKYFRGFDYERVAGDQMTLPAHVQRLHLVNLQLLSGEAEDLDGWYIPTEETLAFCCPNSNNTAIRIYGLPLNASSQYVHPGTYFETLGEITKTYSSGYVEFESGRGLTASEMSRVQDESQWSLSTIWQNVQTGQKIILWKTYPSDFNLISNPISDVILATDGEAITSAYKGIAASGDDQNTIWKDPEDPLVIGDAPSTWRLLPASPVIS